MSELPLKFYINRPLGESFVSYETFLIKIFSLHQGGSAIYQVYKYSSTYKDFRIYQIIRPASGYKIWLKTYNTQNGKAYLVLIKMAILGVTTVFSFPKLGKSQSILLPMNAEQLPFGMSAVFFCQFSKRCCNFSNQQESFSCGHLKSQKDKHKLSGHMTSCQALHVQKRYPILATNGLQT